MEVQSSLPRMPPLPPPSLHFHGRGGFFVPPLFGIDLQRKSLHRLQQQQQQEPAETGPNSSIIRSRHWTNSGPSNSASLFLSLFYPPSSLSLFLSFFSFFFFFSFLVLFLLLCSIEYVSHLFISIFLFFPHLHCGARPSGNRFLD